MSRIPTEVSTNNVLTWLTDNQPATPYQISGGLEMPPPTVYRILNILERDGKIKKASQRSRNVSWIITGHDSRMPVYTRESGGGTITPLDMFEGVAKRAHIKGITPPDPMSMAYVGATKLVMAAVYAASSETQNARQALTNGRQDLIRAYNQLDNQRKMVRRILDDERLQVKGPNELIKRLLEDKNYPIDFEDMYRKTREINDWMSK